jgi:hypothetical protein
MLQLQKKEKEKSAPSTKSSLKSNSIKPMNNLGALRKKLALG